jgi:hypothetical protein
VAFQFDDRAAYAHEPFVSVTRGASNQPMTAGIHNKLQFDDVVHNDMGAWDVANGWFVCLKSGRVQMTLSCPFNSGTLANNTAQVVFRVDNGSGGLVVRHAVYQEQNLFNGIVYCWNGASMLQVEYGWRVYPELYTDSPGSMFLGNAFAGFVLPLFNICYMP